MKKTIIHHSNTPNGKSAVGGVSMVIAINRWHELRDFQRQKSALRHWQPILAHIGYHLIIMPSGLAIPGRAPLEKGAHCSGHNADSYGICLVGIDKFTKDQWVSLKAAVEHQRLTSVGLHPVYGHNEFSEKQCPGFSVEKWMERGKEPLEGFVL